MVIKPVLNIFFFTIRFHKYKKVPKSTKKHQKVFKNAQVEKSNFFTIKFHEYKKHQKTLKSIKNIYVEKSNLFAYLRKKRFYDETVGFIKLIKVLKLRQKISIVGFR